MNNKNSFSRIKEYLATVVVSIVVVFLLALCVELELLFNAEQKVNNRELNTDNLLEFCKIDQLQRRLEKEPENYVVAIKLAKNFEKLNEIAKANEYYSSAVKISKNSPYSIYSYSMFLAKQKYYGLATELAESLTIYNKKNFEYKANIYEQLAKSLYKDKEYLGEVKAYQVAQKYAKNLNNKATLYRINKGYANAYIHAADYNVEKGDIDSAILDLKNSLKIVELPLAKYKLGLIYLNVNKVKAEQCFSDVLSTDIYMINPYIYHKLLTDLIQETTISKNLHSADFYSLKLNKLKRLMQENYVFKNDIIVSNFHIVELKKMLSNKKRYFILVDINNNTEFKLNSLYLQLELFIDNKQYVVKRQVINRINPINVYDTFKEAKIPLPDDFDVKKLNKQSDVIVKYFAKKRSKAPWTLIKIESVHF